MLEIKSQKCKNFIKRDKFVHLPLYLKMKLSNVFKCHPYIRKRKIGTIT